MLHRLWGSSRTSTILKPWYRPSMTHFESVIVESQWKRVTERW
jgi:hypothetical protein